MKRRPDYQFYWAFWILMAGMGLALGFAIITAWPVWFPR